MISNANFFATIKQLASQTRSLTVANMKSRYRKTLSGFFWVVLNPLVMFGIQAFVFSQILKLDIPNYFLYLVAGILPWVFITQSLDMTVGVLINSSEILKSFDTSPVVFLLAQLFDNFINFFVTLLLVMVPIIVYSGGFHMNMLLLPIPLTLLVLGVFLIGWILSISQVFFRDTKYILSFLLNGLFFLTPIFYTPELVPEEYRHYLYFNVFFLLIRPIQLVLTSQNLMEISSAIVISSMAVAGLLLVAASLWRRSGRVLYEYI